MDGDVIVVDDFYVDPGKVRKLALTSKFIDFGEAANFPGKESRKAFCSPKHAELFEQIICHPIDYDPHTWVFGKFRLATAGDPMRTSVHLDIVDWTAVVYLTPDADSSGGLVFYRHLVTGLDRAPKPSDTPAFGCQTLEDFDRTFVMPDTTNMDAWSPIHRVDHAYNRCVLFRGGRLFHGIGRTFGQGSADGRLTQNFFFMEQTTANDVLAATNREQS